MDLICKIGFHSWRGGCKCKFCDTKTDKHHNWKGCKCTNCEKSRDEQHDWSNDCQECAVCGKLRDEQHIWEGCKCIYCGKTRDEEHTWEGCKCIYCGKKRDEGHTWDHCKCIYCGIIHDENHKWDGCICTYCDKTRDKQHDWSMDCEKCSKCDKERDDKHDFSKDCEKCSRCGQSGLFDHSWIGDKCEECGKIRNIDDTSFEVKRFKEDTVKSLFSTSLDYFPLQSTRISESETRNFIDTYFLSLKEKSPENYSQLIADINSDQIENFQLNRISKSFVKEFIKKKI